MWRSGHQHRPGATNVSCEGLGYAKTKHAENGTRAYDSPRFTSYQSSKQSLLVQQYKRSVCSSLSLREISHQE